MTIVHIWTVLTIAGLLISLLFMTDVLRDRHWLRRERIDGGRSLVARIHLRGSILAVVVQALFVMIGLGESFLPRRPIFILFGLNARGWSLVAGLFLAEILINLSTAFDRRDRQRLLKEGKKNQ
jgi:hypothetical protein